MPHPLATSVTALSWPWDSPPPSLTASLASRLSEQFGTGPAYLLINPDHGDPPGVELDESAGAAFGDGVRHAREAVWQRPVHTLHSSEYHRFTEVNFPYLVHFNEGNDPWLTTSIEWAVQEHLNACAIGTGVYRIGGWVRPHGERSGHALARQLALLMHFRGSDGSPGLARLQDRRVLHLLHQRAGIDWSSGLKGVERWCYLDHNLVLQNLQGAPGTPGFQALPAAAVHSGLLDRSMAVNLAVARWLRSAFPLPENALALVLDKVRIAGQRGVRHAQDQGAYAAEALIEPAFEHWPDLDRLIKTVARFHQRLSDGMDLHRPEWTGKPPDHWRRPEERPA
jgi:hypothetical protein